MNGCEIGKRILAIRGRESRKAFAEKLGIGTTTLQRYENGERVPDLDFLLKLQVLTGASLDYLVTGRESLLPENEMLVLENYRAASSEVQNRILLLLLGGKPAQTENETEMNKNERKEKVVNVNGMVNSPGSQIIDSFNQGGFSYDIYLWCVFVLFAGFAFLMGVANYHVDKIISFFAGLMSVPVYLLVVVFFILAYDSLKRSKKKKMVEE